LHPHLHLRDKWKILSNRSTFASNLDNIITPVDALKESIEA
jgi:hypothetical protein